VSVLVPAIGKDSVTQIYLTVTVIYYCYVFSIIDKYNPTRMWANAKRDGRPAKYRWRPMFNAAKFGGRPLLECRAGMLPRRENPLKFAGVPQTNETISAASRPKFATL